VIWSWPESWGDQSWRDRAACAGSSIDWFFERGAAPRAKRLCDGCPVRVECLESAFREEADIRASDLSGVRGGLTPSQRRTIRRRRRLEEGANDDD